MADDKLFPESGDQTPTGGHPGQSLDQAAGAAAYVESAADSGGIDLGGLLAPSPEGPVSADPFPLDPFPAEPAPAAAKPAPAPPRSGSKKTSAPPPPAPASDFPEDALGAAGPAVSVPGPTPEKSGGPMVIFVTLSTFWHWFWSKFTAIPPLDDIFDRLLMGLGLQRKPGSMLRRANALAQKGRLVEAVRFYRDLLTLRPLAVAGYDGLGRAYFRMGLSEEANREFGIAESLERLLHNRDDLEAAASLALGFLERKQAKIAVSMIEPVLIAHFYSPGNRDLLKAMGRVYTELRANKKTYQIYSAGLAQHPDDYEFHISKGEAEVRAGNLAEGERLIHWGQVMKRLRENPRDAKAKMAMGEMYLKEQKTEEGLKALREAAIIQPDNVGLRWRLFNLYQKQGNYDESLKYFLEVMALEPDNEDLQYRLADFYRRNNHRDEALVICRTLTSQHPREPRPHALLGEILVEMGSFEEGQKMKELAQTLECGLKASPNHQDTVQFMKYLFRTGQNEEGREWLERGLAKWPYHGELVLTKVKLLYQEYRYQEAMALLKRLISVKPDVAEPHIWIAMCHQRLGDNMGALAESQLATRLAPKSYTAHKVLGDILKEQKKLSQANAAYEVAEMMRQVSAKK